jgi:hypothetical protein
LQTLTPGFWKSLNDAWQEHGRNALSHWRFSGRLLDDWFRDVVQKTLEYWTQNPESEKAQLKDGYIWYAFYPCLSIPAFAPTFGNPFLPGALVCDWRTAEEQHLLPIAQLQAQEKGQDNVRIDDFYARMDAEYSAYREAHRALLNVQDNFVVAGRDAEFTVCLWNGIPVPKIRDAWFRNSPGDRTTKDPEKTIRQAAKRYAEEIGLSMPKFI